MESFFRSALTLFTITSLTLAFGAPIILCASLGYRDFALTLIRIWSLAFIKSFGVRLTKVGVEKAKGLGSCVIMSSHRSHLDGPILLCTLPFHFTFVIKRSLAQVPVWGWAVTRAGYIAIDRKDHQDSVQGMKKAEQLVRQGLRVLTFPEGTRSPDGQFKPFKKGGFVLAIEAQVPILPVAVVGSYELLPKGALRAKPGDVVVVVGEPVETRGLTYEDRVALMEKVEATIKELYATGERILEEIKRGRP